MKAIAENIKLRRKHLGWSQADLAEAAGVSQQLISQIERGVNGKTYVLPQLAAALKCSLYDLDETLFDTMVHRKSALSYNVIARMAGRIPDGFGESDAVAFSPKSTSSGTMERILALADVLAPKARTPSLLRAATAMPTVSIAVDDYLLIDLNFQAIEPGTLVIAQAYDENPDFVVTLVREYYPGSLVSREPGRASPFIALPASNVSIVATVEAVIRAHVEI